MQQSDVEQIFDEKKESFFQNVLPSKEPIAILLGGQSACGKSTLLSAVKVDHPERAFLSINGDLYRTFHPEHNKLIQDAQRYSSETQIFSNVFTEKLIDEAIKRNCNIIVEGTMRNPDVPMRTSQYLKDAGYKVEVYAIAAPAAITQLGIYNRFQEEINSKGVGRLAELSIHDSAINGLSKSLDTLYSQKAVDKISIHSYLAKERIKDFTLKEDGSWNCKSLPSVFVNEARSKQMHDMKLLQSCIQRGEKLIKDVANPTVKNEMEKAIQKIKETLELSKKKGYKLK